MLILGRCGAIFIERSQPLVSSLNSGPIQGVLSSSGSSPVFSSVANQPAVVVIGLSRLASAMTPALMRSTDSGTTWSPVTLTSPGPAFVPWGSGQGPTTFFSATFTDTTSAQYRTDASFSAGSVFFLAASQPAFPAQGAVGFPRCSIVEPGDANGSILSLTTSQLNTLISLRYAPLTLSQIAAPLTMYKRLNAISGGIYSATAGIIAKLSVPSGALTGFDNTGVVQNRAIRASRVQVVSIMDSNGASVSNGLSFMGDGTGNIATYTAGATVNAIDLATNPSSGCPKSSGSFSDPTCFYGIHGYTSAIEACSGWMPISLSAFGL